MNIHPVRLPRRDTLADTYINDFERTAALYEYHPYEQGSFEERLRDVQKSDGHVSRSELTTALRTYNERVNPHQAVYDNINMLEREGSVVVIGGQQAGVMTGPLYTVYKAITILQLARQQSHILHVPVIPVFWIAGEDHDLEEVNHVWTLSDSMEWQKIRLGIDDGKKRSIGHRQLITRDVENFLKTVADHHPDSAYKNVWLNRLRDLAAQSDTMSDWFARVCHWLFAQEGLVLFDSAADEFKQIAAPLYARLIAQSDDLDKAVAAGTRQVEQLGFRPQVERQDGQANVFVVENGERRLLFKQGEIFVTKDKEFAYTRQELTDIVYRHPEKLSTNVVTRPLLQHYLFPTLAAVLGPGEIAYWGQYGQMFSLFGWKMPVLFPRISFTLVERDIGKTMEAFALSPLEALYHLDEFREKWLNEQVDIDIEALFSELAHDVRELHKTKTQPVISINRGIADLVKRNRERILREVHYLEGQILKAIRIKHNTTLKQFERIQHRLTPHGKPQERVYNVFTYVNEYGWDWLNALVSEALDLTEPHYMVYL